MLVQEMCSNVVFRRWVDKNAPCFQYVFDNLNISEMQKHLNRAYVSEFNKMLKKVAKKPYLTQSVIDFFCLESNKFALTAQTEKRLCTIYEYLQNDVSKFIEYIKSHGFTDELINKVESETNFLTVIDKYNNFANLLFANSDTVLMQQYLFGVSNNLFEFCFYQKTCPKFMRLLKKTGDYPLVRMIYSIMWKNLSSHCWKDWNRSTLDELRTLTQNGGTVVYIAGGTDIYQLLKYGIYNIKIVDPVLPSQPSYYSDVWDWFIKGNGENDGFELGDGLGAGLGDVLRYDFGDKKISMIRARFEKTGSFKAKLSTGENADIEQSKTQWTVLDDLGNKLGSVVFERRCCNQSDFVRNDNQFLLISFNELYYIASNYWADSWGIDILKLDSELKIFVKQLRNPVNKVVLCNMRKADNAAFSFIKLGSNIN